MAVLEETNVEKRLALALELIKKELQMSKMQRDISKKVEDKIKKSHHEHMLREQLKGIVVLRVLKVRQNSAQYSMLPLPQNTKKIFEAPPSLQENLVFSLG